MKLNETPALPMQPESAYDRALQRALTDILRPLLRKVNGLASGGASDYDGAATSPPTTGAHAAGDFLRNSAPAELGPAGSKYVIAGWICITAGTPGTWTQCRYLTGA